MLIGKECKIVDRQGSHSDQQVSEEACKVPTWMVSTALRGPRSRRVL